MDTVALHRNVEDIVGQYEGLVSADAAERQRTEGELLFAGLDELMGKYEDDLGINKRDRRDETFERLNLPALTPYQISSFLEATSRYEAEINYNYITSLFLTHLIRESYNAGHNGFVLNIYKPLNQLCRKLKGKEGDPIEITINGDLGGFFAEDARDISVKAGDIGIYCAVEGRRVSIEARNVGGDCLEKAQHCTVKAESIGVYCSMVGKHNSVTAATIGQLCGQFASNSVFRVSDKASIAGLKKYVQRWEGNRIYFIAPDGKERRVYRWI
ncbi:MAG TPA: hypothetical protein HA362_03860 [Nanoarchaeota archaeon]|nr:hypothetical protein [Nanoarchaeota archaeon]